MREAGQFNEGVLAEPDSGGCLMENGKKTEEKGDGTCAAGIRVTVDDRKSLESNEATQKIRNVLKEKENLGTREQRYQDNVISVT
jgi:hypothetical protein